MRLPRSQVRRTQHHLLPGLPVRVSSLGQRPAHSDALSNSRVAVLGPQAPEKGKSGAGEDATDRAVRRLRTFTWLNGNARTKESPMDTKFFTPEIRADVDYIYDFNHPKTIPSAGQAKFSGPMKSRVTQLGVGGDFITIMSAPG